MRYSHNEIKELMHQFSITVSKYTDILLSLNIEGKCVKLGSCIHIKAHDKDLAISCNHVAHQYSNYFSGLQRLKRDIIPENNKSRTPKIDLVYRSNEYDLTVFNSDSLSTEDSGKSRYNLCKSEQITLEICQKNISSLCYIYGILGSMTRSYTYPDGINYIQIPIYTAIGPIVSANNNKIVADFAEKEIYELNVKSFPHMDRISPTGGYRNIHGASGSGLWIQLANEILLAGVLVGSNERSSTKHLIRFLPIWIVIEKIKELYL